MAHLIDISLHPFQSFRACHSDVRHVLYTGCLWSTSLSLFFCVCQDPMGEEHHVRRTSRVPPFMVVVSLSLKWTVSSKCVNILYLLSDIKDQTIFFVSLCFWVFLSFSLLIFIFWLCVSSSVLQCFLGPLLCSSREERHMWTLQWSQGLPWLRESALMFLTSGYCQRLSH